MKMRWVLLLLVFFGGFALFGYGMFLKTSAAKPECIAGACPTQLSLHNNEEAFVYPRGTRFSVALSKEAYPPTSYRCDPAGVVAAVDTMDEPGNLYTSIFEGITEGTCTLTNKDFTVRIVITAPAAE